MRSLLGEPYEPCVIDFPDAGYSEFLMEDVAVVVRDLGGGVALLLHFQTRKPIGVRWEHMTAKIYKEDARHER